MSPTLARIAAKQLPLGEARALVGLAFKEWPNNAATLDEWAALREKGLVRGNFDITPKGEALAEAARDLVKEEWI